MTTVTVKTEVSDSRIADMLVGAFEGGSNYWIIKLGKVEMGTPEWKPKEYYTSAQRAPLGAGGFVVVYDEDHPRGIKLNRAAIKRGLDVMAREHSGDFDDLVRETDDATTADVFLQCALFGEVVYG